MRDPPDMVATTLPGCTTRVVEDVAEEVEVPFVLVAVHEAVYAVECASESGGS